MPVGGRASVGGVADGGEAIVGIPDGLGEMVVSDAPDSGKASSSPKASMQDAAADRKRRRDAVFSESVIGPASGARSGSAKSKDRN